ncbi:MAG: hypothetical protein GY809_28485 [Planctomycetes bacterium]|nr:hypothetical protein [Planctomycetota bacterium]
MRQVVLLLITVAWLGGCVPSQRFEVPKGQSLQRFSAHFSGTPPRGSLIRVTASGHAS